MSQRDVQDLQDLFMEYKEVLNKKILKKHTGKEALETLGKYKELLETFVGYTDAFITLQPEKPASFFHLPSMLIISPGIFIVQGSFVINNAEQLSGAFSKVMEQMKSEGYRGTQVKNLKIQLLSNDIATIAADAYRRNTSGQIYKFHSCTFTMSKIANDWKIITATYYPIMGHHPYNVEEVTIE